MALADSKQQLKDDLAAINPMEGDIVNKMIDLIEAWIQTATVTVTIPDDIAVQVDLNSGHGRTIDTIEVTGTIE